MKRSLDRARGPIWADEIANREKELRTLGHQLVQLQVEAVIFEATGIYTERVERYLQGPWQLFKINPADVTNHDGRKTDQRDASRLAQLLLGGIVGRQDAPVRGSVVLDEGCLRLRTLTRKYERASQDAVRAATRLTNLVYQLELSHEWLAKDILTISGQLLLYGLAQQRTFDHWLQELENDREQASSKSAKGCYTRCLHAVARHPSLARETFEHASQTAQTYGLVVPLREGLRALLFARQQKKTYHQAICTLVAQSPTLRHTCDIIMSITGMGLLNTAIIVAETGSFTRFATDRLYISWLGLNPRIRYSGRRKTHGRISKRGNTHIRRALYQNVTTMLKDPTHPITVFYHRLKRRKGPQSGNLARTAAMRKLARLIFLLVTRDEPFKAPKRPSKKWHGVDAKMLPLFTLKRFMGTLNGLAFEFPGTLAEFAYWLQAGPFPQSEFEEP